ncbi:3723_t:CDS:2 [Cetraspora pellucida]|uniref:3723_t:CDS:1 n=1 Tax=Cetraspora pellucida TaxID=1433469 RepID=A0A9N8ZQ46_9GLOM|nr:3723_t:CDS:2 [Cetraspora pellucida]
MATKQLAENDQPLPSLVWNHTRDRVDIDLIKRSFKCCGILIQTDGSEDNMLFDYDNITNEIHNNNTDEENNNNESANEINEMDFNFD